MVICIRSWLGEVIARIMQTSPNHSTILNVRIRNNVKGCVDDSKIFPLFMQHGDKYCDLSLLLFLECCFMTQLMN